MGLKYSINAKLYRLSTGTRAAWPGTGAPASLDEVPNVREVTLDRTTGEADVTTRGSGGYKATAATLIDASVEFEMIYDPTDSDFTAFQTAYDTRATIAVAILDGAAATVGTQGLWADFAVLSFTLPQPLDDVLKVKVTIKPGYSAVPPAWITVA